MGTLSKAAELVGNTSLIFGQNASGKSNHAIDEALKAGGSVLWLGFDNLGAVVGNPKAADFDAAIINYWSDFTDIVKQLRDGSLKPTVIVLDGWVTLSNRCMYSITGGKQPSQQQWGEMGNQMANALVDIRANVPHVIVTTAVQPDDEGIDRIALNRDLYIRTIPLFGRKLFCHTAPLKDKTTNVVIGVSYELQENSTLALRLKPVQK